MNFDKVNIQRIKRDKLMLKNSNLESQGVYILMDDDITSPVRVMIIGPEDTPYEKGFYMFEFKFTKDYPWKPPVGKFLTTDGISRMHPNLYAKEGKICLSLLGTWSGPSWTACQTILSVIISLIPLLNKYPIQCEPGYENEVNQRHKDYNNFIYHENIRLAVIENIYNPPPGCEGFLPIIQDKFKEYAHHYLNVCHNNKHIKHITSSIYTCNKKTEYSRMFGVLTDYIKTLNNSGTNIEIDESLYVDKPVKQTIKKPIKIKKIKKVFIDKLVNNKDLIAVANKKLADKDDMSDKMHIYISNLDKTTDNIKNKSKGKRVPNDKASNYAEGFIKVSENDGREYITKQYTKKMQGPHGSMINVNYNRWILNK